jgi:hypothetical protein
VVRGFGEEDWVVWREGGAVVRTRNEAEENVSFISGLVVDCRRG